MELTPELLLEAKFGPARRGYDMAEVDDFLERCAEGLDVLLARLKSEFERAERAETRLAELAANGAAPVDPTIVEPIPEVVEPPEVPEPRPEPTLDEPMRILVHAERTAEAAITDAKSEAQRIRREAEAVANKQRSEAEAMLATARAEAEEEARRAGEETRRSIQSEVLSLRRDRDTLADDIRGLRRWLDEQRTRMRSTARELQRLVEDPSALADLPVPEVDDVAGQGPSPPEDADSRPEPWPASPPDSARPGGLADDGGEATQAVPVVGDAEPDMAADDPWTDSAR